MTAQGISQARVKRITAALIKDGHCNGHTIEDAIATVDTDTLLKRVIRSESAHETLESTILVMKAVNRAVEELAQKIAQQEQDMAVSALQAKVEQEYQRVTFIKQVSDLEAKVEAGHGEERYLYRV